MASLRWNRLFPACFLFRVPARPGDPPAVPTAAWKPVRDAESRTQHQPGPPEPESASSPDARVRWRQGTLSGATVALLGEEGVSFQLLGAWLGRQVRPPEPDGARRTGGGGTHFTQARPDPGSLAKAAKSGRERRSVCAAGSMQTTARRTADAQGAGGACPQQGNAAGLSFGSFRCLCLQR